MQSVFDSLCDQCQLWRHGASCHQAQDVGVCWCGRHREHLIIEFLGQVADVPFVGAGQLDGNVLAAQGATEHLARDAHIKESAKVAHDTYILICQGLGLAVVSLHVGCCYACVVRTKGSYSIVSWDVY